MANYCKRLIEVDLPIKRISKHARREKSIRHGHISTLHIWWARRPPAACRAVLCAALWPDPADGLCPQSFRDQAASLITEFAQKAASDKRLAQSCAPDTWGRWQAIARNESTLDTHNAAHLNTLRYLLLDFIADFANWDNSTVPEYLETSRALTQAAHLALGGLPGTRPWWSTLSLAVARFLWRRLRSSLHLVWQTQAKAAFNRAHIRNPSFLQASQKVGVASVAGVSHHRLERHLPGSRLIDQFERQFRFGSEREALWNMGSRTPLAVCGPSFGEVQSATHRPVERPALGGLIGRVLGGHDHPAVADLVADVAKPPQCATVLSGHPR